MKTSKLLITSLLAAAAMSVPAWANSYANQTISADTTAIYTNNKYDNSNLVSGDTVINENCTWTWGTNSGTGHGLIKQEGTLSGAGTWLFTRTQPTGANFGRFLQLAGDNSEFTGTFQLTSSANYETKGPNVVLLLGSLDAATNATVDLGQCTGVAFAAGVTSANVGGFVGTSASSWILAKSFTPKDGTQTTNIDGSAWNADATEQTINLTGGDEYAFAGRVGNAIPQNGTEANVQNPYTLNINKTGTGKQTFSGLVALKNLSVSGGELIFSGASADSKGSATIVGTLTTLDSGVVKVLENGVLDLSGATVSLANAIQNSGQVTLSTGTLFEVSTFGQTVSLISGAGTISGVEWNALTNKNFTYNGVVLGRSTVDVSSAGSVNISYVEAKTLTWNGSTSDTWSEAVVGTEPSSKPWKDESNADDAFYAGDSVVFSKDETTTVTVADSGVLANTVTISAGTVSFTGGTITATGGVSVTGGTLSVGATNTSLGTNTITLSGGTLQAGAALTLANAVNVAANSTINTQTYTLTLNGAISASGATLTKSGTGTLVVNGGASGEKLSIEGGVLQAIGSASVTNPLAFNDIVIKSGAELYLDSDKIGNDNSLTWSRLTFEGGTFNVFDTQANTNFLTVNDVVMNGDGIITSRWGNTNATLGNLSGTGNLKITNTTEPKCEALAWTISQIASDYSGTISLVKNTPALTVSIGSSSAEGANFDVGSNAALKFTGTGAYSLGTLTMGSGATLSIASSGVTLKGLSGTGAISLAAGTAASTLTVNQASDTTFAGTIADGIALKKAGTGTLILSGDNSAYAGTVTLEAGTLGVGHANALGTSTVNVTGDANLQMDALAVSAFANDVSVADGKTLSVQAHATDFTGALSGNGNVVVKTLTYSESDVLALSGDNTALAGTLSVEGLASVNAKHVNALGSGMLKITTQTFDKVRTGTVNAAVAGVKLNAVSISLKDAATAVLTADASCNFTVAAGATLYLDIGLLTEATLTGEQVALTIAAASAFDNSFFSAVEVGTYVDDAWQISSEWKYLAGSWDVGAGTLKISAIPEPSMFGLLAGLGALALAGTRRRRKKA